MAVVPNLGGMTTAKQPSDAAPSEPQVTEGDHGSVLEEAIRIVSGNRNRDYGEPEDNFGFIAGLWNTYLARAKQPSDPIGSRHVAMMMVLMKVARDGHAPKRDNLVDIAGYADCANRC